MRREAGFTLLEVLVATTLMSIAVVGLLSALRGSLRNESRLTDYDRAALLARRKMDQLLTERFLPKGIVLEGQFDEAPETSWRARALPVEWGAGMPTPGKPVLERIELEVNWKNGTRKGQLRLETHRMAVLREIDMPAVEAVAAGAVP